MKLRIAYIATMFFLTTSAQAIVCTQDMRTSATTYAGTVTGRVLTPTVRKGDPIRVSIKGTKDATLMLRLEHQLYQKERRFSGHTRPFGKSVRISTNEVEFDIPTDTSMNTGEDSVIATQFCLHPSITIGSVELTD